MWLKEEDSEIQGSFVQKPLGRAQKTINKKKQNLALFWTHVVNL